MGNIIAVDQGTSSSRAVLFQEDGEVLSLAQQSLTPHYPRPGWVELDPEEIWRTQQSVLDAVLADPAIKTAPLDAIGITNQRETVVVWERATGRPIYPAIVWQDRRTADRCEELVKQQFQQTVSEKTGLIIDPYFSATKIAWILDTVPGARQRAENGELCCGTIDSWLIWKMTDGAVHVTDPSNASRTMLYNIHEGQWDHALLQQFNIPLALLPHVVPSVGIFGSYKGIPLAGIAGDQQAALFGQGCHQPGTIKNTYGTGCFLLMNTGSQASPSQAGLLRTVAWQMADTRTYALEGSVFMGGAVIQWLRDNLGIISQSSEVEALASSVTDSREVTFVPAFTGLGAPYWNADARAEIVGMDRGVTKAHIARAALEGIALQVTDVVHAMHKDAGCSMSELRVDGGASSNRLLLQMQADFLKLPVVKTTITESTAFGAAALAGFAVGTYQSLSEIAGHNRSQEVFEPTKDSSKHEAILERWHRAIDRMRS
jgi:glycerol kinase